MKETDLIARLDQQLNFLASTNIRGLEKDDVRQELVLMLLEDTKRNPGLLNENYSEGWWFKRLKWYLMNLREKEHRDPVNRSVRTEAFNKGKNNG